MNKKKVLIVEDDRVVQSGYCRALDDRVALLHAFSIEQARIMFHANSGLALIVMDGFMPGDVSTIPLVHEFRAAGFTGPMLASSTSAEISLKLVEAGCSYKCPKRGVVAEIELLFDL
ncbi:MAG: response regulator [Patescibacteria group bacterium]